MILKLNEKSEGNYYGPPQGVCWSSETSGNAKICDRNSLRKIDNLPNEPSQKLFTIDVIT